MRFVLKALLVLTILAVAVAGAIAVSLVNRGISTKAAPTWVEVQIARAMRHLAIPRADRERTSPVPASPKTVQAGLEHFADHCAICHGNDGSGDVQIGRNLYPKAPDLRDADTQTLSDGELFHIIENGVRLTGMPGWSTGTPEGEEASWHLVHFIRHLPRVTDQELARMEELNPKSPHEFREEEEMRRFLEGEEAKPPAASPKHPHSGGHDD
ncbi:MAG: c-type cytochrome [Luteitalea sp.]|nr:c-type cytochrome [Luteitalea sp.]